MSRNPITVQGGRALRIELDELQKKTRPSISKAIAEARAFGDLKENAEYHAAKEQQSFVEARIRQIESRLANVQVIDITQIAPQGKVIFGATVTLLRTVKGAKSAEVTYRIVGEDEANIDAGLISALSPVGRSLIDKAEGEQVIVETPGGDVEYEIKAIDHI